MFGSYTVLFVAVSCAPRHPQSMALPSSLMVSTLAEDGDPSSVSCGVGTTGLLLVIASTLQSTGGEELWIASASNEFACIHATRQCVSEYGFEGDAPKRIALASEHRMIARTDSHILPDSGPWTIRCVWKTLETPGSEPIFRSSRSLLFHVDPHLFDGAYAYKTEIFNVPPDWTQLLRPPPLRETVSPNPGGRGGGSGEVGQEPREVP